MSDAEPESQSPSSTNRRESPFEAPLIGFAAATATALVMAYAFAPDRAGSASMLLAIGALDAVLAACAIARLHRRGELMMRFRFARGDIALAGMTAGLLYVGAMVGHLVLAPHLSAREAWIMRLYLQLGDPRGEGRELIGLAVFFVAALEEIAWRGLVMRSFEDRLGPAAAVGISSALFALAHVPTMFGLADPVAGLNPLLVVAGFGCSLVWGAIATRTRRLVPTILAHALFSWAIVELPIWRL